MATKLYLHRGPARLNNATLPAQNAEFSSALTPSITIGTVQAPLLFGLHMDTSIGAAAQTSYAYNTQNVTTAQQQPLLRWVSPPLAAQSLAASQSITVQLGFSTSNTISAFQWCFSLYLWRPSTGALVSRITDCQTSSSSATTSETNSSVVMSGANVAAATALDGDVLVLDVWRNTTVQTMGTQYVNNIFYDGTTEGSATNNAAFLNFANTITFQSVTLDIQCRDVSRGTTSTTPTITLPVGTTDGDLLICFMTTGASMYNTPAGWTRIYLEGNNARAIYAAPYSASLTLAWTGTTNNCAWICGAYFKAGQTLTVGDVVGNYISASGTVLVTGQPVTGASAGEYEVLAYGIFAAITPGAVIPAAGSVLYRPSTNSAQWAALGHNSTTSNTASTTMPAFSHTLAAAETGKTCVGILLRVVVALSMPNTALAGPVDAFN